MYIRTRLTLWFLLILTLVLAAFSITIYQLTRNNILLQIDKDLRHRATIIAAAAQPGLGETTLSLPKLDVFTSPDTYLQILDQNEKVLASSDNLGNHALPFLRDAITSDQVREVRVGSLPLLVYGQAVQVAHQIRGYVLVARSVSAIYQALSSLNGILYPVVAITLILAGLVSWLLVRRAMRPLEQLATTATQIAVASDHSLRLNPQEPRDEINRLTYTFNGMLQSLEDAYRKVQDANDLQRRFLADVSHELRTPLTILLSSLDLIKKEGGTDPDFQAKTLESVRGETERMARMVTQLLILARTDANAAVAREPLLIVEIVADICRHGRSSDDKITVHCSSLESLEDAVVLGNSDYLKQVFLILVENALKYTPDAGRVEITGVLYTDTLSIMVADTGIGIPGADVQHIFDRFYRAENARFCSGLGLGLSIAQSIVEQHHGKITVESQLGKGSCFTVLLPLLNAEAPLS